MPTYRTIVIQSVTLLKEILFSLEQYVKRFLKVSHQYRVVCLYFEVSRQVCLDFRKYVRTWAAENEPILRWEVRSGENWNVSMEVMKSLNFKVGRPSSAFVLFS